MRALVTLAPEGVEPYAEGVRGLSKAARLAGWEFHAFGDEFLNGDRPWQAKRLALRRAFELGAERVAWSDSDVIVRRPELLSTILNQSGKPGVWVWSWLTLDGYFEMQAIRNAQADRDPELARRARSLYAELCRAYGLQGLGLHFHDWFVVHDLPRDPALRMLDVWDEIAGRLLQEGLTWSDGLSLGIAAEACRIPIRRCLPGQRLRAAVVHLLHSAHSRRYQEKGVCLP